MATSDVNPLECSICLEKFKNPRLISCHHSFCFKCLDDFIKKTSKNNKFNCPVCRREIEVPRGGVGEFSANFYINTSQADNNPESKLAVEGLSGNAQDVEKYFCEKHPKKEVEFFCVDCDVVACSKCSVSIHKTHELLDLDEDETRQKYLKKLSQIKSKLEASDKRNKQLIETADKNVSQLSVQAEEGIQKIRDQVNTICASIRQNGEDMVTKIQTHVSVSKKEFKATTSTIERHPASLKKSILNTLKNETSVVNLIKTTKRAQDVLTALNKRVVLPPLTNFEFELSKRRVPKNPIGRVKISSTFEKLNLCMFGPDKNTDFELKFNNFSWGLSIRKVYSTLRIYLILNDRVGKSTSAHSDGNYTITLLNLNDESHSISRSFDDRYSSGWHFLDWDKFIDTSNGFVDKNLDFYVKITFL